jgi:hypothetical protein
MTRNGREKDAGREKQMQGDARGVIQKKVE